MEKFFPKDKIVYTGNPIRDKVIQIEGEMPNKKASVFFQQMKQEKQLLLKFAKLRILEEM